MYLDGAESTKRRFPLLFMLPPASEAVKYSGRFTTGRAKTYHFHALSGQARVLVARFLAEGSLLTYRGADLGKLYKDEERTGVPDSSAGSSSYRSELSTGGIFACRTGRAT